MHKTSKNTNVVPTILVVDDDIGIREVFSEVLDSKGYRVQVATEAASATKIVNKQKIDLALVDIWLKPGIDGIELIKQWREKGQLTFPVAIVSGHAEVPTAVQAMRHGAIDVLTKPVNSKQLLDFVANTLSSHSSNSSELVLHKADLGSLEEMVTLKGSLLRAASQGNLTLLVGAPEDGCELFARLMLPLDRPLLELHNLAVLATDPTTPLTTCGNSSLFVRGLGEMTTAQQRGLYQLIHNALRLDVRVLVEANQLTSELVTAGKLIPELAKLFAAVEVKIPPLKNYADSLVLITALAGRLLAVEYGRTADTFAQEAIDNLASELTRWKQTGLAGLLGTLRTLLQSTPRATITTTHIRNLLFASNDVIEDAQTKLFTLSLRDARQRFEQLYLSNLMKRTHNNFVEAAKIAQMERSYLYRKVASLMGDNQDDDSKTN